MNIRIVHPYIIILLCALSLATSCGNSPKKYVIGVSQCSMDSWREKLNSELRTAEYLNDSVEVRLASSNDDNLKQIAQINQFVDQGVDLLIVSPNQLNAISEALDRAYDRGIPVILVDRKTQSDKYTAFIGCDNYELGHLIGSYIAQQLGGRGRIAEIRGLEGSSPAMERHRGFVDAVRAYPGLSIVASEAGDWKEPSGRAAMNRILAKTDGFDYLYAHNDRMAHGAYTVAKARGMQHKFRLVGVDGLADKGGGLDLVRNGILDATFLYPTKGNEVMDLALDILRHRPYLRDNRLHTSIVTRANADLVLMEAKDSERQRAYLDVLHQKVSQYDSAYHVQRLFSYALVAFLVVIVLAAIYIYRNYIIKARLNEQLARKNNELNRLNNEVMELTHSRLVFFTNISHELRTPLTLIADPVELLLADTHIKGRSRELLTMVRRNAIALQQLVGSILDFRKIQNGKMELRLVRFDIVKAMNVWTGDFRLTAERRDISLHLATESLTEPTYIVADKEKVARIVFNLLSNALKYTPKGGDIFVSVCNDGPYRLRIDVRDTGRGISADEAKMVFERFFQAKGAASGTGIGLALVKSFVELHHGEARVESEDGKGADFVIILPRKQATNAPVAADEAEDIQTMDESALQYIDDGDRNDCKLQQAISEQTDKPTLLIIDDNNDIRQYERTLLQDRYFVLEAADGREGLEVARKEVPDLVVCDVMMPVMDGLEFTEQLKTNLATSHIPVIMLTAKNLDEQRAEGYEHGADSYITKPFHSKVLMARIDNLLRQRQLLKNVYQASPSVEKEVEKTNLDDRDKLFIKQLNAIIQQRMTDSDFGVEDIGKAIGLSRVQLYRKVKALTGTSVVDLIRKARLAKARRLLATHSMSVSEVAYEVGFSTPSYFTKCFKDEFGILPGNVE